MRTRRLAVALLLILFARPGFADTYPRQPGVDAIHYVFRLTVDDASDRIAGEALITFRLEPNVAEISLDLASAVGDKGMTVTSVAIGDHAVVFAHAADRLQCSAVGGDTLVQGNANWEGFREQSSDPRTDRLHALLPWQGCEVRPDT